MSFFYHLEKIPSYLRSTPFPGLLGIRWRADQVLKRRSKDSLSDAAAVLQEWITDFKESRTKEETAKYITERIAILFSEGGWELNYLRREEHEYYNPLHEAEIRELLENWPSDADEKPEFPSADDIGDLEALTDILCSGYPYDDIDGFKGASEFELYAVLALMQLEQAASHIRIFRGEHELKTFLHQPSGSAENLIFAGNFVIEAMETICYAERNLSDVQLSKLREEMRRRLDEKLKKEVRSENARKGGLAKNFGSKVAREFVIREWAEHRLAYENNKSAFARDYSRRVKNELDVDVTDKTIREVWLSGPAAPKKLVV